MFRENTGGIRIDHIVGLIDPWVYKKGKSAKSEDGAGRLYSSPEHEDLGIYTIAKEENLNEEVSSDSELRIKDLTSEQVKLYAGVIEKILIAAAEEEGLNNLRLQELVEIQTSPLSTKCKRPLESFAT